MYIAVDILTLFLHVHLSIKLDLMNLNFIGRLCRFNYPLISMFTIFSERLEDKFSEGLAIIGVHSAKFENEKSEFQLENAIKR